MSGVAHKTEDEMRQCSTSSSSTSTSSPSAFSSPPLFPQTSAQCLAKGKEEQKLPATNIRKIPVKAKCVPGRSLAPNFCVNEEEKEVPHY